MCGEKAKGTQSRIDQQGSPPRMRGKEHRPETGLHDPGITPAYAGKSCWLSCAPGRSRDHPRVCGEKTASTCLAAPQTGSPPHVRGKVEGYLSSQERRRITPACAGKRFRCFMPWQIRRDHPRMCGEKVFFILSPLYIVGSPPHVRGKAVTPRW